MLEFVNGVGWRGTVQLIIVWYAMVSYGMDVWITRYEVVEGEVSPFSLLPPDTLLQRQPFLRRPAPTPPRVVQKRASKSHGTRGVLWPRPTQCTVRQRYTHHNGEGISVLVSIEGLIDHLGLPLTSLCTSDSTLHFFQPLHQARVTADRRVFQTSALSSKALKIGTIEVRGVG